ncbi:Domain of unknown function DUF3421 [Phaffia rhodozyma]|uniref:Uncharacterized protein n=1 Tax=Phaffia rhodozyma TaxID=264483 RepID=A0A0F7SI96_PHARH|nr:Domain of unknown function DUF3421 [Phaffia rhodozyma]
MVQTFSPSTEYPPLSVVEYNGGLYQTQVFLPCFQPQTPALPHPWVYLGVNYQGVPTHQSQLVSPLFKVDSFQSVHVLENEEDPEWGMVNSAHDLPSRFQPSLVHIPSPPKTESLEDHEASLERQPNVLLSEATGEVVFKTPGKGLWSFSKEDQALERLKEGVHRRVLGRDNVEDGRAAWLLSAKARIEYYQLPGAIYPSLRWVYLDPSEPFPVDALPIGEEREGNNQILYACRGFHNGTLQIGKCAPHIGKRHSFSYAGRELQFISNEFEILCGDQNAVRWSTVPSGSEYEIDNNVFGAIWDQGVQYRPVEGGREKDGMWIGVGRGQLKGGTHPGKVHYMNPAIMIGWGGTEHTIDGYQVLAYR